MSLSDARFLRLAIAMGPGRTRDQFLSIKQTIKSIESFRGHYQKGPLWSMAKNIPQLISLSQRAWLEMERQQIKTVFIDESDYPLRLKSHPWAPAVLFIQGSPSLTAGVWIAIVGSRAATFKSIARTEEIARKLCEAGYNIISGGAIGIDAAAHTGALSITSGKSVAVLGNGLANPYPMRNRTLFKDICTAGGLVSSFWYEAPPLKQNFPIRNNYIAALAQGVVIIQAGAQSGALYTAKAAHRLGIKVMSMQEGVGCLSLLASHQAIPIHNAHDVIHVMQGKDVSCAHDIVIGSEASQVKELLIKEDRCWNTGDVADALGWPLSRTAVVLLQMELAGWVELQITGYRLLLPR